MSDKQKLFSALAKAQKSMRPAIKDATNPHFRSKYATLTSVRDAVMDAFSPNGLGFDWQLKSGPDGVEVKCVIFHESGERLEPEAWCFLPVTQKTAQGYGSAITYGQRYTLIAAAGISTDEDDDGNAAVDGGNAAASGTKKKGQKPQEAKASTPGLPPQAEEDLSTVSTYELREMKEKYAKGLQSHPNARNAPQVKARLDAVVAELAKRARADEDAIDTNVKPPATKEPGGWEAGRYHGD